MKRNLQILFFCLTNVLFGQNFTYSGNLYNANGSGANNMEVKLYRRTVPNITGFSSRTNYNGHSYYRSNGSKYWLDAKADCENMGGHLATISNASENTFLYNTWPSGWIGYYQDKTGAFYSEASGGWRWTETYVTTNQTNNYDVASYTSGTSLVDIKNSNNMTLYNSPVYTSSGGKYLTFNGSNNYAISPSLTSYFNNSNIITLVAWVYPTGNGVIVDELGTSSTSSGWHESVIEITGGNTLRCGFWNGIGISQISTSITLNQWHMIAVVYDGTKLIGYRNGVSFGSVTFSRQTPHQHGGGNEVFALGLADATNMGSGAYGSFRLGAFQVYNRVLTPDEIDRNFVSLSYRFGLNPYLNWNPGEPNNSGGEDYAQFVSSGRWNDLPNNFSLQYVIEFDYIVDTTAWVLYSTSTTNSLGYYSFNVSSDPSKEYYLEVTTKTPTTSLGDPDAKKLIDFVLLKTNKDGLTYHVYDLNSDNKITVSDNFLLLGKKSGLFNVWGTLPTSRIYTTTEYNAIRLSTSNVRNTYSGVSTYKSGKLTSGGTLNLYIISPGFYNSVSF